MRKINICFLVFLLIFSMLPIQPFTISAEIVDGEIAETKVVLFGEQENDEIDLYKDAEAEELLITIPDDTEVTLLNSETSNEDYSLIRYTFTNEEGEIEEIEGYVHNDTIIPLEEAEEYRVNRNQSVVDNTEEYIEEIKDEANQIKEVLEYEEIDEQLEIVDDENIKGISEGITEEQEEPLVNEESDQSTNINEQRFLNFSIMSTNGLEESISLLGHIKSRNVKIYPNYKNLNNYFTAGAQYTNKVYYIKREVSVNGQKYYLLSTRSRPNQDNIVGWVKADDMDTRTHTSVDNESKTFYVKGNGRATYTAWGGQKDVAYEDLTLYKNQVFKVNLTEKVGNNTWYRGILDGKQVWLHENFVHLPKISSTSRLGHIKSGNVPIYKELGDLSTSFKAGSTYTNAVYYIKSQAVFGSGKDEEIYYLLSTSPSSTRGVVGWAKSTDLSTHPHVGVDKKEKLFIVNGKGKATTKAWGGRKDTVYDDLTKYRNQIFIVNLTEKVGNNIWYRGILDGKQVWLHSNYVVDADIKKTSLLGHIKSGNVKIYETLGGSSFSAGSTYTNAVYYIKVQATYNKQTYYLLSTSPSSTRGVVGWAKAGDIDSRTHTGVDKISKVLYVKGNGKATTKAWGGRKDTVFADLSKYKGQPLKINLTEKVGDNTWYRGILDGKQVWIHSSYLESAKGNKTSLLGHIKSRNVQIYDWIGGNSFQAGSDYTNAVYYIKLERTVGNQKYYLISRSPSSINGVVGWVKSGDMDTRTHTGVDKNVKTFYLNGKGRATTKAWGGRKDEVHSSLSEFEGELFFVNLTEKVGNNIWYRGKINNSGPTVWVHVNWVTTTYETTTNYNITLDQAVKIQLNKNTTWRSGQGWVTANEKEIRQYLDPSYFMNDEVQRFQFLNLSKLSGASEDILKNYLKGRGVLSGHEKNFLDAARKYGVNELYLIAHARLETGNGTSALSNGSIEVGQISTNKYVTIEKNGTTQIIHIAEYVQKNGAWDWEIEKVDSFNRNNAKSFKKTHNLFGIGAYDRNPNVLGAIHAYKQGWYTVKDAIFGGAKWISDNYIRNEHNQNTLYKMKWNPNMDKGYAWKQYASDIGWASKQVSTIYNIYKEIGFTNTALYFDYPVYK